MKTIEFILSVDFEPTPSADEIERFTEQVRDLLSDAATDSLIQSFDFCGSVEINEVTLHKPDRRKRCLRCDLPLSGKGIYAGAGKAGPFCKTCAPIVRRHYNGIWSPSEIEARKVRGSYDRK